MGRGVSSGGGQSSLGYLFGGCEAPKSAGESAAPAEKPAAPAEKPAAPAEKPAAPAEKPAALTEKPAARAEKPAPPPLVDNLKQIPAGIQGSQANNYYRADGQNCGNFITDRPSTKVQAAPGGGSSLGYLFGNGGK